MQQPTIADVARAAGVSVATVSRALRGLDKVHPETRERVVQAAAQLDYIASPTASGLASGRSRLIGIITPFMARWFFTGIMSAIEKTLREHQHHILLMDLERSETSMSRLSLTQGMLFKRVDGLIVINVELQDAERDLVRRLGLPVVAVGSPFEDSPCVGIDDIGSAALAAEHLLALGHRKIAYVGRDYPEAAPRKTPIDRLEGFHQAMSRAGINTPPTWVLDSDWTAGDSRASAMALLSGPDRPTAVLAASDEMALGVWGAARQLGLEVPRTCPSSGSTTTSWPPYSASPPCVRMSPPRESQRPAPCSPFSGSMTPQRSLTRPSRSNSSSAGRPQPLRSPSST